MEDSQRIRSARQATADAAKALTRFREPLPLDHASVRFPGFHQTTTIYKKGTRLRKGARCFDIDIVVHESVPTRLRDGTTIYSDIFLPATLDDLQVNRPTKERVPAIVAWSPYGKQGGTDLLDDYPLRAGVPASQTSGLQKWEAPDPAEWCPHGYAVINPDARGAFTSEGDIFCQGYQEAFDAADLIEWLTTQSWCSGKIALAGNSWLALMQWKIASLRPPGLVAIAPWEGFMDGYREDSFIGGIPNLKFSEMITGKFAGKNRVEDVSATAKDNPFINEYWHNKLAHCEDIVTPTYAAASFTSPVHTFGTLRAFSQVPSSTPKWLRVHNTQEWSDFYAYQHDLRRFFDFYLKDKTENGWDTTPPVRLSVLDYGDPDGDIVNRAEKEWPLKRTQHVKYYLTDRKILTLDPPKGGDNAFLDYDSNNGSVSFSYDFTTAQETTGYVAAHLNMSCPEATDMDVFVQIEKFSPAGYRQGTQCIRPQNRLIQAVLGTAHRWSIGMSKVGMLFFWGSDGRLRASHAKDKDEEQSQVAQPVYKHVREVLLQKGEMRTMEIPMRPQSMLWKVGDTMKVTIAGKPIIPFFMPGVEPQTNNKGRHQIHCDGSYILIPHV